MNEPERRARNAERLAQAHPAIRDALMAVVSGMEARGWRPRAQDGYRTLAVQRELEGQGTSWTTVGLHNICGGPPPAPMVLAVDILQDERPLSPDVGFCLDLAICASITGRLETGLAWGLPRRREALVEAAVRDQDKEALLDIFGCGRLGNDPCHVEIFGGRDIVRSLRKLRRDWTQGPCVPLNLVERYLPAWARADRETAGQGATT